MKAALKKLWNDPFFCQKFAVFWTLSYSIYLFAHFVGRIGTTQEAYTVGAEDPWLLLLFMASYTCTGWLVAEIRQGKAK